MEGPCEGRAEQNEVHIYLAFCREGTLQMPSCGTFQTQAESRGAAGLLCQKKDFGPVRTAGH